MFQRIRSVLHRRTETDAQASGLRSAENFWVSHTGLGLHVPVIWQFYPDMLVLLLRIADLAAKEVQAVYFVA